jgi:uncharacterized damage-inducible protein DinB
MKWTDLIATEVEYTYGCTQKLMDLVDEDSLGWKPAAGDNWMTTGELLMHITDLCGATFKGYITGDWLMPEGADPSEMSDDDTSAQDMLTSVAEAKKLLAANKQLALDMLAQAGEERLENDRIPVGLTEEKLGYRLLWMVGHMAQHKGQLFYYLKLQGKPVDTNHLW